MERYITSQIKDQVVHAKEWTTQHFHTLGVTAHAWMHAITTHPLFQELTQAVIETAQDPTVQHYVVGEAGKVAARNPALVNVAMNVEATVQDATHVAENPILGGVLKRVAEKPYGTQVDQHLKHAAGFAQTFMNAMRGQALQMEAGV